MKMIIMISIITLLSLTGCTEDYYINYAQGNNDLLNNTYGEMNYHNYTGFPIMFSASSTYYEFFFTEFDHNNGFTAQGGFNLSSNLTAQYQGVYQLNWKTEGSGQNNHEYHVSLFINGIEYDDCESVHKMSAGGDINIISSTCLVTLEINDTIDLRIADYTSTGEGIYYAGNINLVKID